MTRVLQEHQKPQDDRHSSLSMLLTKKKKNCPYQTKIIHERTWFICNSVSLRNTDQSKTCRTRKYLQNINKQPFIFNWKLFNRWKKILRFGFQHFRNFFLDDNDAFGGNYHQNMIVLAEKWEELWNFWLLAEFLAFGSDGYGTSLF